MSMNIIKYNMADRYPGDIDNGLYSGPDGTGELIDPEGGVYEMAQIFSTPGGVAWIAITAGHEWRLKFPYTDPPGNPKGFQHVPNATLERWGLK